MSTGPDGTDPEGTGPAFSLGTLLEVRSRSRRALHLVAGRVEVGMLEDDARATAERTLAEVGLGRSWHRAIVRFGPNTTKDFGARSQQGVVLGADDIFFVDIGPLAAGHEGDAGDTFVVGADPDQHRAKLEVRTIWDEVRDRWSAGGLTGVQLYELASARAEAAGWRLNPALSGHRLSDHPHSAHRGGPLAGFGRPPSAGRWVLEIAIAHPERPFGAFYEDLLLEDQSFEP